MRGRLRSSPLRALLGLAPQRLGLEPVTGKMTDDVWEPLRSAVPSFADRWAAFTRAPWYESDASYGASEMARHLVAEVAAGRDAELPAFFNALDRLLDGADEDLYNLLTIGLLEDLVHEAQRHAIDPSHFDAHITGDHARDAWKKVLTYTSGRRTR